MNVLNVGCFANNDTLISLLEFQEASKLCWKTHSRRAL